MVLPLLLHGISFYVETVAVPKGYLGLTHKELDTVLVQELDLLMVVPHLLNCVRRLVHDVV